jgi:spore coat protein CotH
VNVPRLLIIALLGSACTPAVEYEPWIDTGTSEDLLGADVTPEIGLVIDEAGVASLRAEPRTYVKATLQFDGVSYYPVGVRLKGQNSFLPFDEKPSLRIKVDEYIEDVTIHGLKDLTLNNMSSDASMMHEVLAYHVAREAGLPASRANHATVTINGEPYGLYANVETIKKRMIGGSFADNGGSLFEATDVDFAPQYVDAYELESGPDDRTEIAGLADALTRASATDAISAAGAFIDMAHFQEFWAMESVVGQFDAFPYSFPGDDIYVYADPTSGHLWLIPSGMDETFFAADFSPAQTQSVLAARCKESPACYQGYVDATWTLLGETETWGLEAERARIQDEIAPLVAADTHKPYTMAEVTEGQAQLGYFIRGRRATLGNFLPPPTP